ncbi:uncharacterized protein KY384_005727 [Bacidia gigantensis]|uniref:uncharacterized protein n=1 Tax=Bacidia gigantensis TaxID=2732470 RepID=UPI001D03BC3D|nr:uncharacterized protein KY384_005727 [Bacidia gigantensis]KAG8529092.1 hypothetical protein KY384_005727 [Bacidia gigantensis]
MSGFEVAGVALGAFPIAIGALNHFLEGVQTIKYWRRYRIKLSDYASVMETHRVYYLDTLDELLQDIVPSEEMEELMSQPGGVMWKDPRYEQRLKQRLGRSYHAYIRTLAKMHAALNGLCEKLGVDMAGKVLWEDYSVVEREMKRIKVTLKKNVYKEILDDIDKANKDIRDITHQNVYLEPLRQRRLKKRPIAQLKLVRAHARSLYSLLVNGKAWKCECNDYHIATLRLESRPRPLELTDSNDCRFKILLSTGRKDATCPTIDSQWQEIDVVPLSDDTFGVSSTQEQHDQGRVKFAPDPKSIPTSLALQQDSQKKHGIGVIEDICTALCKSSDTQPEVGFLNDEADARYRHYIFRAMADAAERQSVSLRTLLVNADKEALRMSFLRGDRLRIAVILASSVLQLTGTKWWLESEWSSEDILFHNSSEVAGGADYSYPYLPWKLCTAKPNASKSSSLHFDHRSRALLALGFTLIELCFGRTLAAMYKIEDGEAGDLSTRLRTADRLLRSVYNEMGPSYGDVVRRCLRQPFDVLDMNLDNEDLQQKVFDDIVTPLAHDLENFHGRSRIV